MISGNGRQLIYTAVVAHQWPHPLCYHRCNDLRFFCDNMSYKAWKNFMRPKQSSGGKAIPRLNVDEFGYKRYPRSYPYFKQRRRSPVYCPTSYAPTDVISNELLQFEYPGQLSKAVDSIETALIHLLPGITIERAAYSTGATTPPLLTIVRASDSRCFSIAADRVAAVLSNDNKLEFEKLLVQILQEVESMEM